MYDILTESSDFLVRIVFLRALAFVHAVAFLVALRQNKALIGDNGITPARRILNQAESRGRQNAERRMQWRQTSVSQGETMLPPSEKKGRFIVLFAKARSMLRTVAQQLDTNPKFVKIRETWWDRTDSLNRPLTTLLWLAKDRQRLNPWLDNLALTGLVLSSIIFVSGAANVPLVLGIWLCQRSLMAVGGPFYGFGWEPQLAELSFHALFMVPLLALQQIPNNLPIPKPVSWSIRWYLFRIMMGAGLIKLKSGDPKWKWPALNAMDYFYETQPVPNPFTRYFHWMPPKWHKFEVLVNHFVELVAPWLLIIPGLPTPWRRAGGIIQLIFQAVLIMSGNLSFLNWLTMVPAILCLDDALLGPLFSNSKQTAAMAAAWTYQLSPMRQIISWSFLGAILWLSIPVVRNLLAKKQVMNSSFDPLRLVNTYGAFGTVNEVREEFVIMAAPTVEGPWREYEFQVKPGDPNRAPKWISPYHHRLDWQMWIAANCRTLDRSPWMFNFLIKLLQQDQAVLALMAGDPFAEEPPHLQPKYIRIDKFAYNFHKPKNGQQDSPYWDRKYLGRVYPRQGVASLETLKDEIKGQPRRAL